MDKTHSYLKVELYDNPAWEPGTLSGEITDITSVNVNLNRGLSPHTASFSVKNTGADCDYAGKGIVITAYTTDGTTETTAEVFRGFIVERKKIIDARSLTHTGWEFECEDVLATWEAYNYEIEIAEPDGTNSSGILADITQPPKFYDCGAYFSHLIRKFSCRGNGLSLFAELRKQAGHVASGAGDIDGLSASDNFQVYRETETVPECEGITAYYRENGIYGETTEIIKTIFMAKSQQWWVPIAWSEEDDTTGEYTLHIIYQTSIQHSKAAVDESMTSPYSALYFDDEEQSFTTVPESDFMSEGAIVADYDYTLLGDITLVQPTESSIHTNIMIHKSYVFAEAPESEESTGASLIEQFKRELPDIMSLHISTSSVSSKILECNTGSTPKQEEDYGYIKTHIYGTPIAGNYADERLAEMQYTNEKQFQYTYSLVPKIPIPAHGNEAGNDIGDEDGFIVESTSISWGGDGVNISTTIRYKSDKTAAYKRISKYNLPRYFKKQMTTQIEKVSEADYAKIDGDSIIFSIDGEEVKISLTDNILTDDGIVRW